ncbi:MAG: GH3 auxin-responsive promoter family protein [Candidatus Accumulibacter sp.]|jgi:hypothetical protein|nr:GH3 auxin-responsive promoter family protein [Accumulibacter sp.]
MTWLTWLTRLLTRHAHSAYLRRYGSPRTLDAFRERLPLCRYEDLTPWMARVAAGEADVLFAGTPVAFERTGGSGGGAKLIPYSDAGLEDFQRNLGPWIERLFQAHAIAGRAYFATSPAARAPEYINGVPVGLPDAAYLGERLGKMLAARSIVTPDIARQTDLAAWRRKTLRALAEAEDMELISVWSPTFLLRLLDDIPDPQHCWPRLKLVSCWQSGASRPYARELAARLPQARFEGKGLMSTEGVASVPDAQGRVVPAAHGFVEFLPDGAPECVDAPIVGAQYEIVLTTASGLYRYRTGDRVQVLAHTEAGLPVLEFIGRDSLCCDLVGEKLTDAFVAQCLQALPISTETLLVPDVSRPGYVLVSARPLAAETLAALENRLAANPQYAYARALGQLAPLRALVCPSFQRRVEHHLLQRGQRLGDLKASSLRGEAFWLACLEGNI